jgi:signal transduction histidine kinase
MAIDAAVAVAWLAGLAVSWHPHQSAGERTAALLLLAPFASLPLAVRRRWPVPVFFIVLAASVACGVVGLRVSTLTGPTCALYTVAVQADRTWSLLALAAVEAGAVVNGAEPGAGVNVTLATAGKGNTVTAAFTALAQLTVWIAADSVRRRRAYSASLRERSLREALSDQRVQIARELHDIVAHAMSVVAVQAGVGSHLIATRPDEAAKSLHAIEATARAALSETRSLLSVSGLPARRARPRTVPGRDAG